MRFRQRFSVPVALLNVLLLLGAACGDDTSDDIAEDIAGQSASSASPTALAGVEEDVEQVAITIDDGELSDDQIEFQEESPAIIQVTNNDDVSYIMTIGVLVAEGVSIVPGQVTAIEFTTATADEYEAQLLSEDGGEPLDTMTVIIEAPGSVNVQP